MVVGAPATCIYFTTCAPRVRACTHHRVRAGTRACVLVIGAAGGCSYEWAKRALSGAAEELTFAAHFAAGFAAEVPTHACVCVCVCVCVRVRACVRALAVARRRARVFSSCPST